MNPVNKDLTSAAASWTGAANTSPWVRRAGVVVAGSALLAVCSHIAIPLWFTPVPLTVQPFAVLLLGLLLSPRMAGITLVAYLTEGALGLPVFVPGSALSGGVAHLLGPTAGYLMAYPAAAVLISWLWRRGRRSFSMALASAALGDLVILTFGALWLALLTHISARTALTMAVLPFLPGDALKAAAAAGLAAGWHRLRLRTAESRQTW